MKYPNIPDLSADFFAFGMGEGFFESEYLLDLWEDINARYNDGYTSGAVDIDPVIGEGDNAQDNPWIFAAHSYFRGLGYKTYLDKHSYTEATFTVDWTSPDFTDEYPRLRLWEVPGMEYTGTTTSYDIKGWQARDAYLMQTRGNDIRMFNDRLVLDDIYKKLREVQVLGSPPTLIYTGPKELFQTISRGASLTPHASGELYIKRMSKAFEGAKAILAEAQFTVQESFYTNPASVSYWFISGNPVNPDPAPEPEPTP